MCDLVIQAGLTLPHVLCECVCVWGGGEYDQRPQAAAGSPLCCPLSCTAPPQHCPNSHTEPVKEQGFIPLGQLSTLYFLCYLCSLPFISSLASPQGPLCHFGCGHINLQPQGSEPPSPSSSFISRVSLRPGQQLSWCTNGLTGVVLREDHCEGALGLAGQTGHGRLVWGPRVR